jgi:hypothetical protein
VSETLTVVHELELPNVPAEPMSENEVHRQHWAAIARQLDPWRDTVAWLAKTQRRHVHRIIAAVGFPVTIRVTIPFKVPRRRDPSNYVGSICKAIVDGLVVARWFPGDDPRYVKVVEPVLVIGGLPKIEVLA